MHKHVLCASLLLASGGLAHAEGLPNLPSAIAVPNGVAVATFHAVGAQIYICAKTPAGGQDWTFREPIAALMQGGKTVGRHFAGPTWEFADWTHVTGKTASQAPGKTAADIAWLKLTIVEPAKSGPAAGATTILRIDTKGGVLSGACPTLGQFRAAPYAATYAFVK